MRPYLFVFILLSISQVSLFAQTDTTIINPIHAQDSLPQPQLHRRSGHIILSPDSLVLPPQTTPTDTNKTKKEKLHKPSTALLLSLIPGGGQIYNKKAWKLPIIYGGLAASTVFLIKYGKETRTYTLEYRYRMDTLLNFKMDPKLSQWSDDQILNLKYSAQQSFEIAIAATVIIYALNLLDAFVDAHLFYFNVNDNLSMRFMPTLLPNYKTGFYTPGLCLTLRF